MTASAAVPDRGSAPPSPLPPAPSQRRHTDSGWRPADDDDSARAVAHRARRGERIAVDLRTQFDDLRGSMDNLSTTIKAQATAAAERWATVSKLAWGVGIPVLVGASLGLLALAWHFVSTLHH